MEHACSQCGTTVEDGNPFCPNCHAPQIKVPVRPPTAPVSEPLTPGTPEDLQPPAEPVLLERGEGTGQDHGEEQNQHFNQEESGTAPEQSGFHHAGPGGAPAGGPPPDRLQRRPALHAAFVAGMLAAVGTSIPVVPLAMLCMFASGGLAVTLYRRRAGQQPVTAWMGAKLGVMAGGLGFGFLVLLSSVGLFTAKTRSAVREYFGTKMQEAISTAADPQARQLIERMRDYIATDHGLILVLLLLMAITGVIFLIFSALGGALGAALFGRDGARHRS